MKNPLRVAITPGDPAGIGPDIVVQLAKRSQEHEFVVFADPSLIAARAVLLKVPLTLQAVDFSKAPTVMPAGYLKYFPSTLKAPVKIGVPDVNNVSYILETLNHATHYCLNHQCAALVTGPIHKATINQAGIPFQGHTEYLAELAGTSRVVMMLMTEKLKVALTTTHIPLAQVATAVTQQVLKETLEILNKSLCDQFYLKKPRILVCGLNPHAGEEGHLGREEIEIIQPVIQQLQARGFLIQGPLSADTIFSEKYLRDADVILAMYHDQGLPVLKAQGFGEAVNVTLGLPFIRTSVDHGTAFDLAGTGKASASSLEHAIKTAIDMAVIS